MPVCSKTSEKFLKIPARGSWISSCAIPPRVCSTPMRTPCPPSVRRTSSPARSRVSSATVRALMPYGPRSTPSIRRSSCLSRAPSSASSCSCRSSRSRSASTQPPPSRRSRRSCSSPCSTSSSDSLSSTRSTSAPPCSTSSTRSPRPYSIQPTRTFRRSPFRTAWESAICLLSSSWLSFCN